MRYVWGMDYADAALHIWRLYEDYLNKPRRILNKSELSRIVNKLHKNIPTVAQVDAIATMREICASLFAASASF